MALAFAVAAAPAVGGVGDWTRQPAKTAAVKVTDSAFRWFDAAVGAAAALGVVLIVVALRVSVRREAGVDSNDRIRQEETR